MIDLCKIKEDFSLMVKDAQPWTLTQFVMWLDLKLSEFKIKGYMVLDHNVKTKPKWLAEEDRTSDVAPPCRHCNRSSSEQQFYSDLHSSPSSLQQRTVTKTVEEEETNIRGKVGIIDLSHGISNKESRSNDVQLQSYRPMSSQEYHIGETASSANVSKERDKRIRPDVIEIDAPSPPEKRFIPANKGNIKTSTPLSRAHLLQRKMKNRLPLLKSTSVYTSTSSTTTPTFSTSYTSPTARSAPSNPQRNFALGAPPLTNTSFSTSSSMSDYQNLENIIAQTVQYNETLSQNQQAAKSDQRGTYHGPRQTQEYGSSQNTFIHTPSTQSSFMDVNVEQQMPQTFSDNFADKGNISSSDQNTFVPSSEAVPVALHANIDVINRDNSIGSAISSSDITEIKIESDNEDTSINESFLSESSTSHTSTVASSLPETSLPIQSQSHDFYPTDPSSLPKPGLVDQDTAKAYNMVELVTGSGVYVYDKNIAQAFKVGTEKETGTYSGEKMARYLLNVFWSRKELVGATLSKAGRGKKILNQQIIEAILGFCLSVSSQHRSLIRRALVNSVTAATCQAKTRPIKDVNKLTFAEGNKSTL